MCDLKRVYLDCAELHDSNLHPGQSRFFLGSHVIQLKCSAVVLEPIAWHRGGQAEFTDYFFPLSLT